MFWALAWKRSFAVSVSLKFLLTDRSSCVNRGPTKTLRPRTPNRSNGVGPPGYAGLAKSEFVAAPPGGQLPPNRLLTGNAAGSPASPHAIRLLSVKIPSAGLAPL